MYMPWEDVATGLLALRCEAPLTSANENWRHLVDGFNGSSPALYMFPYNDFQENGKQVKIHHLVPPWCFLPLYNQESLTEAFKRISGKNK
jgi:hypothetical protein